MTTRRSRKTSSLPTKMAELSIAVPQVIAHRVTRMALAGPTPSARDKKEFELMVDEKKLAFTQSLNAMALEVLRVNQALAVSAFTAFWLPSGRTPSAAAFVAQFQRQALSILTKGVTPVHGKAVANAKRLARTKLR